MDYLFHLSCNFFSTDNREIVANFIQRQLILIV